MIACTAVRSHADLSVATKGAYVLPLYIDTVVSPSIVSSQFALWLESLGF